MQARVKMLRLSILVCFITLLQASVSTPILATKPKPVDLAYTCTEIFEVTEKDFKHDDVPIILLHGLTENKDTWHGVFEIIALATKKKVCLADLRNHGQSPWNDEEYDVIAMTEDVRHLIDTIKAPKAIVLGHSLGGRIAVHLALNYPEKVEKVIVEDMRPNGIKHEAMEGAELYAGALKELVKLLPEGLTEEEGKDLFLSLLKEYLAKVNLTFVMDDITLLPIKCPNGKCQLSVNPVLLDALVRNITELMNESSGRFDGPALFIYGGKSISKVGEDESNIKKLFPKAKLVEVEGAGHTVHLSKTFSKEVIEFINNK